MSKKMKVLQVLGGLYTGGAESYVMNMYRSIDKDKVSFEFLIHERSKTHYDDEVLALGGIIHRIPDRTEVGTLSYILTLVRELKRIKPDVVHVHTMLNAGIVMFAAFVAGVRKRITHSHSTSDQSGGSFSRGIFRWIMRMFILIFSTDLAACGTEAARFLFGRKAIRQNRHSVLNNAVNLDQFKFDEKVRKAVRKEWGVGDRFVIGHVGRMIPVKNHFFLIDVFHAFQQNRPDSVLVLIGDGVLRSELERKVSDLKLTSCVKFLGIRNDVNQQMQGMDAFLFPSIYEGFPVVLVEAQAAGLNCVVSDAITHASDVTGRMDFRSLNESPQRWAQALLMVPNVRVDTSEAIRARGYDTVSIARQLTDFYRERGFPINGS